MKKEQAIQIKHFGSMALTCLFILMSIASIPEFFTPPKDQKGFCFDIDPISAVHTFQVRVLDGLTGLPIRDASVEIIIRQFEFKKISEIECATGDPKRRTFNLGTFQTNAAGEVQVTAPEITFKLDLDYAYVDILAYKNHYNSDLQSDKLTPANLFHQFASIIYNINDEP